MANSEKVVVPILAWYGDEDLELEFPDSWDVTVCSMKGYDAPCLSDSEIRKAFANPIGTKTIKELARGKKEVVILFDDMSRPTPSAVLIPYILEELATAGIPDDNIRFIAAIGAHGSMNGIDFRKKLGDEVMGRFLVYNHNPYENCTYLGETSRGTPVSINSEFMSCDLKIAIGSIVPHPTSGFGGGGKMVLPGVAHIDTIAVNHRNLCELAEAGNIVLDSWGRVDDNAMRLDLEEVARMAGLDVSVNALTNLRRDTIGLFVGDLVEAHREGVKMARKVYATEAPSKADVVVANAYTKANEAALVVSLGSKMLKEEGGDLVVIGNIPEGQICHYLVRSFGKKMGGGLWGPLTKLPSRTKRMIALGPYIDKAGLDWVGPLDKTIIANSWVEILDMLKKSYGNKARVVVIPDGTLQYFPRSGLPRQQTSALG